MACGSSPFVATISLVSRVGEDEPSTNFFAPRGGVSSASTAQPPLRWWFSFLCPLDTPSKGVLPRGGMRERRNPARRSARLSGVPDETKDWRFGRAIVYKRSVARRVSPLRCHVSRRVSKSWRTRRARICSTPVGASYSRTALRNSAGSRPALIQAFAPM